MEKKTSGWANIAYVDEQSNEMLHNEGIAKVMVIVEYVDGSQQTLEGCDWDIETVEEETA